MKLKSVALWALSIAAGVAVGYFHAGAARAFHPQTANGIADFSLEDQAGVRHILSQEVNAKAVVIIGHGNGCPILRNYSEHLRSMARQYASRGVVFWLINPEDDRASVVKEASEYGVELPILLDLSQAVTKSLGLTRTADTVIINPRTWDIVYHGAIDDQLSYGANKQFARNNYLTAALDDVLAGREIAVAPVPAKGCAFTFFKQPGDQVTR